VFLFSVLLAAQISSQVQTWCALLTNKVCQADQGAS
jgi:hypothetical protein